MRAPPLAVVIFLPALLLGCSDDPTEPGTALGDLVVSVSASGNEPDSNGYIVSVDLDLTQRVDADGSATFQDLNAGTHDVELTDLADECEVSGDNPRSVRIRADQIAETSYDVECVLSPSGRLVYATDRDGNREVYTIRVDGSDRQRITDHSATDGNPAWSPDGSEIVFLSGRGGDAGIYRVNADGSNVRLVTDRTGGTASPTWAPDGSRIAFQTEAGEIATIRPDGTDLTVVFSSDADPAWSPNSEEIVFTDGEIQIGSRDGSSQTNTGVTGAQPRWSPDGSRIAFWGNGVETMNPDGSDVRRVTSGRHPSWSPDGNWVALMSGGDLFVVRPNGSDRRQVTDDRFSQGGVSWRP